MKVRTLSDKIVSRILTDIDENVELNPTFGISENGSTIGYVYQARDSVVKIQAFTKTGGKNSKFTVLVSLPNNQQHKINPPQAKLIWAAAENQKFNKVENFDDIMNELNDKKTKNKEG